MAYEQGWNEVDGPTILWSLEGCCRTARGRSLCGADAWIGDLDGIAVAHEEVGDVLRWEAAYGLFPVAGVEDVGDLVFRAGRGGVLEGPDLRRIGTTLEALDHLAARIAERADEVPSLLRHQPALVVAPGLRATLRAAFDETGALSGRTYPELGVLRQRITDLHRSIREVLETLVRGDTLTDVLQDRFITQRGDRYVLPIKANADRRAVGIVHAVSNRGQTVFVEPHEVVERNNALRLAEAELEEAERRILEALSREVGLEAGPIERALDAAARLDLACGRAGLSRALDATRPVVRDEGVVRLRGARHPLLALKEVDVVANDIVLDEEAPVLVVSGPNTGGKTVVLKTVGLFAALVRLGVWVPAAEGSRVDLFTSIHAIAGDRQDVDDNASTFSGHVAALARALREARPGALILVDEVASGTDPAQGAALAIATLEAARAQGARVLVTTHLSRLKTWALQDERAQVAGMAFRDGHPTFRMVTGVHGESHALEVARARGLPGEVVDRAAAWLADGDRDLAEALQALDREHARAEAARADVERLREDLARAQAEVAARMTQIEARSQALEAERAEGFLARVDAAERAIGQVVAALQRSPDHAGVARARQTVDALRRIVSPSEPTPEPRDPSVQVGDRVRLRGLGGVGTVEEVGRQIVVTTDRGMTVRVRPRDVQRMDAPAPERPASRRPPRSSSPAPALEDAVPHGANTLDLRGERVDEALSALEAFVDRAVQDDQGVVFVLHGHGTGALKQAIRRALSGLRQVRQFKPAHAEQGGDAYTVIAIAR